MRPARVLIAVLALALIGLLPIASAPAQARPAEREATSAATPAKTATAPRAAAQRKVTVRIVKRRGGQLWLVGGVTPPKGPVYVQRATSCNKRTGTCNFKWFRTIYLKKGRYETRVYAPKRGSLAWRTKVKTTYSKIWVTCKLRGGRTQCPVP